MKTEEDFAKETAMVHLQNMESHKKVDYYEKELQRIIEERSVTAKETKELNEEEEIQEKHVKYLERLLRGVEEKVDKLGKILIKRDESIEE